MDFEFGIGVGVGVGIGIWDYELLLLHVVDPVGVLRYNGARFFGVYPVKAIPQPVPPSIDNCIYHPTRYSALNPGLLSVCVGGGGDGGEAATR